MAPQFPFGLNAIKFGIQIYHRNYRGAAATAAGVGVGFLVPKGLLSASEYSARTGGAAVTRFTEKFADLAGAPGAQATTGLLSGC